MLINIWAPQLLLHMHMYVLPFVKVNLHSTQFKDHYFPTATNGSISGKIKHVSSAVTEKALITGQTAQTVYLCLIISEVEFWVPSKPVQTRKARLCEAYILSVVTLQCRYLCSHDQDLFRWSERLHGHVESLAVVLEAHLCTGRSCQLSQSDKVAQVIQHASKHSCIWEESLIVTIFLTPSRLFFMLPRWLTIWMIFLPLCDPKAPDLDVFKDECTLGQTASVSIAMGVSEMQSESGGAFILPQGQSLAAWPSLHMSP